MCVYCVSSAGIYNLQTISCKFCTSKNSININDTKPFRVIICPVNRPACMLFGNKAQSIVQHGKLSILSDDYPDKLASNLYMFLGKIDSEGLELNKFKSFALLFVCRSSQVPVFGLKEARVSSSMQKDTDVDNMTQ